MDNSDEILIRTVECVDNVLHVLSAIRGVQEVAYINRLDEINNLFGNLPFTDLFLFSKAMSRFEDSLRKFFDVCRETGQEFHEIFEDTYKVSPFDIIKINVDLDDNQEFWDGFCADLNGDNSPERYVLAYVILIGLAELSRPIKVTDNIQTFTICKEETKRAIDIFMQFYFQEVRFDNATDEYSSLYIVNPHQRNAFIHDAIPLERDFTSYDIKYMPDVLLKVGDLLSQKDGTKIPYDPVCDTILPGPLADKTPLTAEILQFPKVRKPSHG